VLPNAVIKLIHLRVATPGMRRQKTVNLTFFDTFSVVKMSFQEIQLKTRNEQRNTLYVSLKGHKYFQIQFAD